ncbi:MAG: YraN family protein [Candidatus Omnitrophica bacterium]|nr:YraN family protein [Candidatus Omnitrophota bacterium]MDD5770800.1 YraN family protein [Candidatus Omnitrophota bacterium]
MPGENLEFGKLAEEAAAEYLRGCGYKIISRNFKSRHGEIDIIAEDKGVICLVEVKARHSVSFGRPAEAVSSFKQERISRAALCYLKQNRLLESPARFDVVSVLETGANRKIELIKNAFELNPDLAP